MEPFQYILHVQCTQTCSGHTGFFFSVEIYYRVNVRRTVVCGLASQGSMKVNLCGEVCGLFIIYNISRNVVDPFQTE